MPITKNGNSIIYFSGAPTPPNFAPTVPILISVRPIKSSNWEIEDKRLVEEEKGCQLGADTRPITPYTVIFGLDASDS